MQRDGQVTILLRPTKVMFSHKKEGDSTEELRTVVAYQNPFTGDYCVHKPRLPRGYINPLPSQPPHSPHSPDSGLSDEYEPLTADAGMPKVHSLELPEGPLLPQGGPQGKSPPATKRNDEENTINKTWNWNYTEYQI